MYWLESNTMGVKCEKTDENAIPTLALECTELLYKCQIGFLKIISFVLFDGYIYSNHKK